MTDFEKLLLSYVYFDPYTYNFDLCTRQFCKLVCITFVNTSLQKLSLSCNIWKKYPKRPVEFVHNAICILFSCDIFVFTFSFALFNSIQFGKYNSADAHWEILLYSFHHSIIICLICARTFVLRIVCVKMQEFSRVISLGIHVIARHKIRK